MRYFLCLLLFLGFVSVSVAADFDRGVDLYKKSKLADAESELRAVVRDQPDNAAAHRYLGLSLIDQDKKDEAAQHINRANELDPSGESKLALARLYIAQKNWGGAEQALNEASGDELEYTRGLLNVHRDRFEDAARDFEAALEKNPDKAYANYYAGLAYNGLRRPDKMLNHFETFLRKMPNAPEARKVRAVVRAR